ncbi:CRISPR-associated endonuclease Cas2 [Gallibacterium genomosp. 3]|uniref:CRISPR-associated endoribonuclease Cas2 n=1 Tax=Gallibacterium genomosp. 3 TaxID=505345 RepID=A0A1A7Q5G1_9PAST|nr:CRISPR-associated endonuclease Cas2 [Gallibacterium genomosp. 3]OBX09336.1 CRISPR-associated protein Cas2 [Gallibacterium genomosp. 3]
MNAQRIRYLVAYDITEHNRLYRIHKKVESYAIGGQKSFYECLLSEHELIHFKQEVTELMQLDEDRLFIFQLHSDTKPMLYGKAHIQSTAPFLLV